MVLARTSRDLRFIARRLQRADVPPLVQARTLQSALVGFQDLSVIATPPTRRQPIRTSTGPFDPEQLRAGLLRERSRGGQSFVVVPASRTWPRSRTRSPGLVMPKVSKQKANVCSCVAIPAPPRWARSPRCWNG